MQGPSSNIAFLLYISRAIAKTSPHREPALVPSPLQRTCGTVNGAQIPSKGCSVSVENLNLSAAVNIYALPNEERTWSLVQQYFHKTGQLLPFIHEKSFCETYFQMKEKFRKVRRTWLGLLNIVLAIAASLSTKGDMPAEKRIQESDVYYQRANGLRDRDSKRNTSLEMGECRHGSWPCSSSMSKS